MMYGYIYKTTNLVNNKIYIGQKKAETFLAEHYLGSGTLLKRAINLYGKDNFRCELLEECSSAQELNEKEIYWINQYKSTDKDIGYNITAGGEGTYGMPCSEETKAKIRATHKARGVSAGVNNPMYGTAGGFYGKHHTEETKEKMRKAALARPSFTEAHCRAISEANSGEKHHNFGKHHNEETLIKMKASAKRAWQDPEIRTKRLAAHHRKPVFNIDTGEVFNSLKAAYQKYGNIHIGDCCRGIRKTAGGYHWKYIEED